MLSAATGSGFLGHIAGWFGFEMQFVLAAMVGVAVAAGFQAAVALGP